MGKSVAARQWQSLGVPVHDADAVVHQLLLPKGAAFLPVKKVFPKAVKNNQIDRKTLGQIVFHDADALKKLEGILHPLVRVSANGFIMRCRRRRIKLCILDIPLLFEIGRDRDVDEVLCVTAPQWVQRRRVLSRPTMTEEKFKAILKKQIPDYKKRMQSDYSVITARGRRYSLNALKKIKNKSIHEQR